jgi:parallel beta-helix repeat protein
VAPGTNDNLIEDNTITGNTNGIVLVDGVEGNIIRRNVVAGNPPVQVSASFPDDAGVDIKNLASPDANTFRNNHCLTSVNAPCPALRRLPGDDRDEKERERGRKEKER